MVIVAEFFDPAVDYQKCYKKQKNIPDIMEIRRNGYQDSKKYGCAEKKEPSVKTEALQREDDNQIIQKNCRDFRELGAEYKERYYDKADARDNNEACLSYIF